MTSTTAPGSVSNAGIAKTIGMVSLAAFLFGFAMIPIYRIACEHVLGIKLSPEGISNDKAASMVVDTSRSVTVEFVGNVNSKLPWDFRPEVTRVSVHPGALTEVWFDATNQSGDPIVGNAVPSVAPSEASLYFNKTECFCFTEQLLAAGESRRMPVRFVVDPQLPANVKTLTLSYTFFANDIATRRLGQVPASDAAVAASGSIPSVGS
ncbi:cytochrome c oxidase assembly protein [Dokdonella sp. MW10]|uniref:cytochrome c oxidase assembly protein n=1 Tax=Dokdonella sp. MW10 TaxID=2992926 RepID=UPI003F81F3B1